MTLHGMTLHGMTPHAPTCRRQGGVRVHQPAAQQRAIHRVQGGARGARVVSAACLPQYSRALPACGCGRRAGVGCMARVQRRAGGAASRTRLLAGPPSCSGPHAPRQGRHLRSGNVPKRERAQHAPRAARLLPVRGCGCARARAAVPSSCTPQQHGGGAPHTALPSRRPRSRRLPPAACCRAQADQRHALLHHRPRGQRLPD